MAAGNIPTGLRLFAYLLSRSGNNEARGTPFQEFFTNALRYWTLKRNEKNAPNLSPPITKRLKSALAELATIPAPKKSARETEAQEYREAIACLDFYLADRILLPLGPWTEAADILGNDGIKEVVAVIMRVIDLPFDEPFPAPKKEEERPAETEAVTSEGPQMVAAALADVAEVRAPDGSGSIEVTVDAVAEPEAGPPSLDLSELRKALPEPGWMALEAALIRLANLPCYDAAELEERKGIITTLGHAMYEGGMNGAMVLRLARVSGHAYIKMLVQTDIYRLLVEFALFLNDTKTFHMAQTLRRRNGLKFAGLLSNAVLRDLPPSLKHLYNRYYEETFQKFWKAVPAEYKGIVKPKVLTAGVISRKTFETLEAFWKENRAVFAEAVVVPFPTAAELKAVFESPEFTADWRVLVEFDEFATAGSIMVELVAVLEALETS